VQLQAVEDSKLDDVRELSRLRKSIHEFQMECVHKDDQIVLLQHSMKDMQKEFRDKFADVRNFNNKEQEVLLWYKKALEREKEEKSMLMAQKFKSLSEKRDVQVSLSRLKVE